MVDEKKIQSHLISIKAAANLMLAEAEKVEMMLSKQGKRELDFEAKDALAKLAYQKRFQRRLIKK